MNSIIYSKIHPPRHAGTLFSYHDGNPLTIFQIFFLSSSIPCYTIKGNQICYYHNNKFPKNFQNLMKVVHGTPGHYDCSFRNINIVPFLFIYVARLI